MNHNECIEEFLQDNIIGCGSISYIEQQKSDPSVQLQIHVDSWKGNYIESLKNLQKEYGVTWKLHNITGQWVSVNLGIPKDAVKKMVLYGKLK